MLEDNWTPPLLKCGKDTDIARHRRLSATEQPIGLIVVVARSFNCGVNRKFETALQVVNGHNSVI